jgi:hypothetical protein
MCIKFVRFGAPGVVCRSGVRGGVIRECPGCALGGWCLVDEAQRWNSLVGRCGGMGKSPCLGRSPGWCMYSDGAE